MHFLSSLLNYMSLMSLEMITVVFLCIQYSNVIFWLFILQQETDQIYKIFASDTS